MKVLGIDLGGTSAKIGVVEESKILERVSVPTRQDGSYRGILHDLAGAARELSEKYGACRIGIGSPGLIDTVAGKVCCSNNIAWENAPLGKDLEAELNLPARIANDAKCAALGEALYGAGRGYSRVLMLTLGTGVGGAYIQDGKADSVDKYADASEIFGHMSIEHNGRLCTCGRRGCLEAYCSATALTKRAREVLGESITAEQLFLRAREKDFAAEKLILEFIDYLADGTVNLVNAVRPQIVVFGGGVSASAEAFLPGVNDRLAQEVFGFVFAPVKAVRATLGNDAGIVGAAALWGKDAG